MSAPNIRGRQPKLNMGQEQSALAQQSISISGGSSFKPPANKTNSPGAVHRTPDRRDTRPMHRNRSRSPSNDKFPSFLLPKKQRPRSPNDPIRPRGPPEVHDRRAGRFPSPGSARHKFFREGDRHMASGQSPRSPDARFGARYESRDPQSPVSDRSPEHYTRRSRVFSSPRTQHRPVANDYDPSTPDRTRGMGGTIDFDGLRDVPLGPRRSIDKIDTPKFGPTIHSPYILIPLPKQPHLIRHLKGMLKALGPKEMIVNDYGWFLIYDDTSDGQATLSKCFQSFNKKRFFSYDLNMQCFPNGSSGSQQTIDTRMNARDDAKVADPSPSRRPTAASPKFGRFEGREIAYPEPVWTNGSTDNTSPLPREGKNAPLRATAHEMRQEPPQNVPAESSALPASSIDANASLLSLRSECDDTASLASGITRSDTSRSKRDQCYVCAGETTPGLLGLVNCSSCKRKVHRRCHPDPPIPNDLAEGHAWSCRRCVKKGRTGERKQQSNAAKPASNLGPNSCEGSPLPTSVIVVNGAGERKQHGNPVEPTSNLGPNSSEGTPLPESVVVNGLGQQGRSDAPALQTDEAQDTQVNAARLDPKTPETAPKLSPTVVLDVGMPFGVKNRDLALSDADDLVEKSFAAAEPTSHTKVQSQKPGKLKMTRNKLPPPAQTQATQQLQPENSERQGALWKAPEYAQSTLKHGVDIQVTKQSATRPSAAEFRALAFEANEKHQSAVRSGTEGSTAAEEQPSRDKAPPSSMKPSAFRQSTDQPEAHQVSQHQQRDDVTSTVPSRVMQAEIPESPDEVRFSNSNGVRANHDPRLLAKHSSVTSRLFAGQTSDASPITAGKQRASKGSGIAPQTTCVSCPKKIPVGPSGLPRPCTICKRKAAATAEAKKAVDAKLSSDTHEQTTSAAVPPTGDQQFTPRETSEQAQSGSGDKGEQADVDAQSHGRVDHVVTAPLTTSQVQGKKSTDEGTELHAVDKDGDTSMNSTGLTGEAEMVVPEVDPKSGWTTTARLPDETNAMTEPPGNAASKGESSYMHDKANESVAKLSTRLERIEEIVGTSHDRPKGSRTILVAMALGIDPDSRMQARDVIEWIAANIPTCKLGEGNWKDRVVSQLTQGAQTKPGGGGYWRIEEWRKGDGGLADKRWYRLLPEKLDEMWTWCPLRQEPLAPKRSSIPKTGGRKGRRGSKTMESTTALDGTLSVSSMSAPTTPLLTRPGAASNSKGGSGGSKLGSTAVDQRPGDDAMDLDDAHITEAVSAAGKRKHGATAARLTPEMNDASSDDEPLSKKRRREDLDRPSPAGNGSLQQHTPANTELEELPEAGNEFNDNMASNLLNGIDFGGSAEASDSSTHLKKARLVVLNLKGAWKDSVVDSSVKLPARSRCVESFHDEWPEYREENIFDEEAKLAEIRKRPTRKQMFGKPPSHSRFRSEQPSIEEPPAVLVNMSPEKRTRAFIDPDNPYPWENPDIDPSRKEYPTLEEFFDFPANSIPIISEGQLAYRDGTRNDDGGLPRAREVFKP